MFNQGFYTIGWRGRARFARRRKGIRGRVSGPGTGRRVSCKAWNDSETRSHGQNAETCCMEAAPVSGWSVPWETR